MKEEEEVLQATLPSPTTPGATSTHAEEWHVGPTRSAAAPSPCLRLTSGSDGLKEGRGGEGSGRCAVGEAFPQLGQGSLILS